MPILSIGLEVGILHQRVIFQDGFPVLLVFPVVGVLAHELLDGNLVAVKVLENEVVEVASFVVLFELNVDVGLAWSRRLGINFIRNMVVALDDSEFVLIGS